jgi:hypothetical protein
VERAIHGIGPLAGRHLQDMLYVVVLDQQFHVARGFSYFSAASRRFISASAL